MTREEELVKHQLEQHQRNQEIDKATQNMSIQERAGFVVGVEWADQHPKKGLWDSKKACKFIKENVREYHKSGVFHVDDFINDLTKAMED